jgi:hypothetical protein
MIEKQLDDIQFDNEMELQDDDHFISGELGDQVKVGSIKETTGYPFNLNEEQIVRIIYFMGSRRLSAKSAKYGTSTQGFSSTEIVALRIFFDWFGLEISDPHYLNKSKNLKKNKKKDIVKGTYDNVEEEFKKGYQLFLINFKKILGFLKVRPAFVTRDIYKALNIAGYGNITKKIIWVSDKTGNIKPRLVNEANQKNLPAIAKMETLQYEIQATSLDKLAMILDSITPKDVRSANLGMKSKALRDIYSMYHMSRLNSKNPNLALININVNSSNSNEKLSVYSSYVNRNREN